MVTEKLEYGQAILKCLDCNECSDKLDWSYFPEEDERFWKAELFLIKHSGHRIVYKKRGYCYNKKYNEIDMTEEYKSKLDANGKKNGK